jgi:hypothetical protein
MVRKLAAILLLAGLVLSVSTAAGANVSEEPPLAICQELTVDRIRCTIEGRNPLIVGTPADSLICRFSPVWLFIYIGTNDITIVVVDGIPFWDIRDPVLAVFPASCNPSSSS